MTDEEPEPDPDPDPDATDGDESADTGEESLSLSDAMGGETDGDAGEESADTGDDEQDVPVPDPEDIDEDALDIDLDGLSDTEKAIAIAEAQSEEEMDNAARSPAGVAYDYLDTCEDAIGDLLGNYPDEKSLYLSWADLYAYDDGVAQDWLTNPEEIRETFEDQFHDWVDNSAYAATASNADIRMMDLDASRLYDVGGFNPNTVRHELIAVRGQVTKRSKKNLRDEQIAFECQRCGTITHVPQTGDTYDEPYECTGCEREGPFMEDGRLSVASDFQKLRIQTLPEKTGSIVSEEIDIELTGDIVGDVKPGDRVIVNIVPRARRRGDSRIREMYGIGRSIERLESDYDDVEIEPHRERINEVAQDTPYESLQKTIAPTHTGDEHIKLALAMQMFGGTDKELPDGTSKRGTVHTFLVGDPGTGKSKLMDTIHNLTPRSVKASGAQTSSSGLTAAAVQDSFDNGGWSLESGALVEANGGIACIDELDDMAPDDRAGMLEAMSAQCINVSKAGITATLPANCSILAAANPEHGRFDDYESVAQQVDVHPALLSRFDLVFTLRDTGDAEKDREIAEHMTAAVKAGQQNAAGQQKTVTAIDPELQPDELRAYIAMGREINPVLTDDAADMAVEAYLDMRDANDDEAFAVGPRMVETIHRLGEASARIRLDNRVTEADIQLALDVHQRYLNDFGVDPETGELDMDVIETGKSHTQHTRDKTFKGLYRKLADEDDSGEAGVLTEELREAALDAGITDSKFDKKVAKMKKQGDAYEPRNDRFALT